MSRVTNTVTAFIFIFLALLLTYSRLPLQDTLPPALFVATAIVTTVLAFALTLGWTACRNGLIGLALFCAVMTVWAYGTQSFYPAGHDGYGYHLTAIWDLADGWHPFFSHHNNIWVDSYPSGYWAIQSFIVSLTGLPFAGMSLLLALALLLAVQAYGFFHDFLPIDNSRWRVAAALLLAAIVAGNPVVLVQIHTHYVDAALYVIGAAIVFFLLTDAFEGNRLARYGVMAALVLLLNTKTSALYFEPLIVFGGFLMEITLNRAARPGLIAEWIREKGIAYVLVAIFSIVVIGYKPFVTNILDHGALLYPDSARIMETNTPRNVEDPMPVLVKFFYGVFAKTEDNHYGIPIDAPITLKIPGTVSKSEMIAPYFDIRRGGFGPFFSVALIACLLAYGVSRIASGRKGEPLLRRRSDAIAVFGAALFLMSAFFPESWWARYIPMLWLGCLFLGITPLYLKPGGRAGVLSNGLMVIAGLAFLGCMLAGALGAARQQYHVYQRAKPIAIMEEYPYVELTLNRDTRVFEDEHSKSQTDGVAVFAKILEWRGIQSIETEHFDDDICIHSGYFNGGSFWCIPMGSEKRSH